MTEEEKPRQTNRKRLWLVLAVLAAILAILIVPPFLSVSRYKASITRLISASLGRPVRLSSVEVRLLPRPGFVLTDLTVEEDPAYGAEPMLHANSVTASIRLLSLWRGHIELDSISVDEASLNLVRAATGRWNLDSLFRTATAQTQSAAGAAEAGKPLRLPYLEATDSRINIKNGAEKLPFSLINAKLSLDQLSPGDWRVRLRGQPVRTDLSIEQADTGVVRLEANFHQAPQLRQMPLRLDLEWREAQLGQLTRLLLGSDAGWRGDLTGDLHLDGTADAAQIKTRLRATGVHRAEFAPAVPMDFDANCTLVAHFTTRAIDNLLCDSPLGDGHIRLAGKLAGEVAGRDGLPSFTVELDHISVAVGLDALRTVRRGLAPGLEADGLASGKITYAPEIAEPEKPAHTSHARSAKSLPAVEGPLTGSITVEGLQLKGNGLSQPILVPKMFLSPTPANQPPGVSAAVAIPAGGASPLTVSSLLTLSGYQITVRGETSISRGRELARVAGLANTATLDALAGDPVSVDLTAEGPWMLAQPSLQPSVLTLQPGGISSATPADTLTGTVTLHNANWKAEFLANAVLISQATLHLFPGELRWDPVVFSYGPVKGTASLLLPTTCAAYQPCQKRFQLQFGALDAAVLQTAFLGARERDTLLSTLLDRLRPTAAPAWPQLDGTVKAESLILGPVTLHEPVATVSTLAHGAQITTIDAGLLGGRVHGSSAYHAAATAKDKPSYEFEGQLEMLSPPAVGKLLGLRSTGSAFDGNGMIELTGFTGSDLAASAKGALHFEWTHGSIAATSGFVPPELTRFDRWVADAEVANGFLTLKENQVKRGARSAPVQATITFADPPKVVFAALKQALSKR
jgi:hypothetical protein